MTVHVVTAIPHDKDILPYIVGAFTQIDTAEDAAEIEKVVTNNTVLCDISSHIINSIDASKYITYDELKERIN